MTGEELLEKIECADPLYIMEADQDSAFFTELRKRRLRDGRRRRNRAIGLLSIAAVFVLCVMMYEIFGFIRIRKSENAHLRDAEQVDIQGSPAREQSEKSSNGERQESSPSSQTVSQNETSGPTGNETAAEPVTETDPADQESRADGENGEAGAGGLPEGEDAYPDTDINEAEEPQAPEGGNNPESGRTEGEIQNGSAAEEAHADPAAGGGSAQETISSPAVVRPSEEGLYTITGSMEGTACRQVSPGEYSVYNALTGEYEPIPAPGENDLGPYLGILTGEGEFSGSAVYAHNAYPDAGIIIVDSGAGLLIFAVS